MSPPKPTLTAPLADFLRTSSSNDDAEDDFFQKIVNAVERRGYRIALSPYAPHVMHAVVRQGKTVIHTALVRVLGNGYGTYHPTRIPTILESPRSPWDIAYTLMRLRSELRDPVLQLIKQMNVDRRPLWEQALEARRAQKETASRSEEREAAVPERGGVPETVT
jgi:hypothetical protein